MAVTGFEMAAAGRLLAPIVKDLYQGAKGKAEASFRKWKSNDFAAKLAKKIASVDKVKTIWSADKDASLISFYYPSKVELEDETVSVSTIDDLVDNNLVIEGIVGQGKSIFLRYLCLQELSGNGTGRIPIFLELRTVKPGRNLTYHLHRALEKLDLSVDDEVFDYLLGSGRVILLLDGFDELDNKIVQESIEEIEYLAEKYNNLKIIVTSRPDNEIQKSRLFRVVKISRLEAEDFDGFLQKLKLPAIRRAEIIEAIKKSPSKVSELVNTPLMLTLLVMVYESEKEIPSELPEFFEKLFHVVFTKHDKLKAGFERMHHSGLSERKIQELFEAFCFMVLQNEYARSLTTEQFYECFSQALSYTPESQCELEDFKQDITKVACLMLEEGFDLTTFLHKSICEYYAAGFIKKSSTEMAELFYSAAQENYSHWEEVLFFLQKIDAYRCYRYFSIPCARRMLELLGADDLQRKPENIISAVVGLYPDAKIAYDSEVNIGGGGSDSSRYIIKYYGPYKNLPEKIGGYFSKIRRAIFLGLTDTMPTNLNLNELRESPRDFVMLKDESGYAISFKKALKRYSSEKFVQQIKVFEESVRQDFLRATKLVATEESKKLIFAKKAKNLD